MNWVFYVILAVVAAIILKRLLFSSKQFGAAKNALLVEHQLRYIELVPQNPFTGELKDAVIRVLRVSGFPRITEEDVRDHFNRSTRIAQLSLLAMALNELGHQPMLGNEFWHPVRNPFRVVDEAYLSAVTSRLKYAHGIDISIRAKPLTMTDWGITDA